MEIITDYPPLIDQIRDVLPLTGNEIFAWNDKIYNPSGGRISTYLIAHEEVHQRQQQDHGDAATWWHQYLIDTKFRYEQELEAHRVEYRTFCRGNRDRNKQSQYLQMIARRLSAPMYGSLVTVAEAVTRIGRG